MTSELDIKINGVYSNRNIQELNTVFAIERNKNAGRGPPPQSSN